MGAWIADGVGGIALEVPAPRDPGVYVFVVGGIIKYVGVTRAGIASRMANYRAGQKGQRTSARGNEIIAEHLTAGT